MDAAHVAGLWLARLGRAPRAQPIRRSSTVLVDRHGHHVREPNEHGLLLGLIERAIFGRAVRRTQIAEAPIFVIGHWRTGTSLLHELLACDPRFSYPTTYQCLEPHHFLLTERLLSRLLGGLLPASRPMDNMAAGFIDRRRTSSLCACWVRARPISRSRFRTGRRAMMLISISKGAQPSAACALAARIPLVPAKGHVPDRPPAHPEIAATHRAHQDATADVPRTRCSSTSCATPTLSIPRRSTCGARFMRRTACRYRRTAAWKRRYSGLYCACTSELAEGRALLHPRRFYELRYEDLVADPPSEVRRMYAHLGLGEFDAVLPRLRGIFRDEQELYHQHLQPFQRGTRPHYPALGQDHPPLRLCDLRRHRCGRVDLIPVHFLKSPCSRVTQHWSVNARASKSYGAPFGNGGRAKPQLRASADALALLARWEIRERELRSLEAGCCGSQWR